MTEEIKSRRISTEEFSQVAEDALENFSLDYLMDIAHGLGQQELTPPQDAQVRSLLQRFTPRPFFRQRLAPAFPHKMDVFLPQAEDSQRQFLWGSFFHLDKIGLLDNEELSAQTSQFMAETGRTQVGRQDFEDAYLAADVLIGLVFMDHLYKVIGLEEPLRFSNEEKNQLTAYYLKPTPGASAELKAILLRAGLLLRKIQIENLQLSIQLLTELAPSSREDQTEIPTELVWTPTYRLAASQEATSNLD